MTVAVDVTNPGDGWSLVVPTIGRPSLAALLESLVASADATSDDLLPARVVLVDDRPGAAQPLDGLPGELARRLVVVRSQGRGPAAARNTGWRQVTTPWVVFVDDDVVLTRTWLRDLADDLGGAAASTGGVQARLVVPLPVDRRPTDWERGTAGLATSSWITADMAYRRSALRATGGFDERFTRAYREDADLAVRVMARGWQLTRGRRTATHPARPSGWWASARAQRGNADDALMRRLHGRRWRSVAQAPRGALPRHAVVTALGAAALVSAAARRPAAAATLGAGWLAGTTWFAASRVLPGPRDRTEVARMAATSVVIPALATWHRLRGELLHRRAEPWSPVAAVLFDRDGTLVHDVPYNGDPELVQPVRDAAVVVRSLRRSGVRVGVVSNQSGVARGLLSHAQVDDVNRRIDALVGPFDVWQVCPHADEDACGCRKPMPGMVLEAARRLGVPASQVVVIGDIAADVEAAERAGGLGVLVPTPRTRLDEVEAATLVARSLPEAVRMATGVGA